MKNFHILCGIIISSLLSYVTCFDDSIHEAGLTCGSYQYPHDGNNTNNHKMKQNLMVVMDAVSFQVKEHGWGAQTLVGNWHPMYALAQCQRDLDPTQCNICFTQARQLLSRCIPKVSGRIYLDGCFLRYDNYTFFNESVDLTRDTKICGSTEKGETVAAKHVETVILNVTKGAGEHKFSVDGEGGVFAMAQCWETLDKKSCQNCLREAEKKVQECVPSNEGRSLYTGCFLRYSTRKFYNNVYVQNDTWVDIPPPRGSIYHFTSKLEHLLYCFFFMDAYFFFLPMFFVDDQGHHNLWIIIACVVSAIVIILLIIPVCMSRKKISSQEKSK